MNIRITRRTRGRDEIRAALAKYGSRENVEEAARADPQSDASDAILHFQLADEDPSTLDQWGDTTISWELEPHEVRLLTTARMELLEKVIQLDRCTISELQRAVKRDYKRVHEDISILERLHTVETHKEKGRRIIQPAGTRLEIAFA